MELGCFSVSLSVKDIHASKDFYEKLGFETLGGDIDQKWLILKNGDTKIGLFQGMFEKNMLTFNPGWDSNAKNLEEFHDVRMIQKELIDHGIVPVEKADEDSTGPAHCVVIDPDGNPILIDQHR